jgi:hypothetical protein
LKTPTLKLKVDIEPPFSHEEPLISLHALSGISTPQTLKLMGYIKHWKFIVLVDSGSTHNFIHKRVAEETHCFVHLVHNFQIMITNGGMMKCGGRCENVKLQMGDYQLKTHLFSIDMGGCDIVLGEEWLCMLGPVTMDFKELYMSFTKEGHVHTLRGLQAGSPEIVISHHMEKLLKKGHSGIISQFNAIQVMDNPTQEIHPDLQLVLDKHHQVFETPKGLPPSRGEHDHGIPLIPGSQPPNVCPYRPPFCTKE